MTNTNPNNEMDWDLTSYFPAFNGPEMQQFKESLQKDIASLREQASEAISFCSDSLHCVSRADSM